ncbi:cytosolic factor, phosphatidylinositol/phosphatidylcholine transfer protein, partial [Kappamyces sp. JEL0680]
MATQQEKEASLEQLKTALRELGRFDEKRHNDFLLFRFLRARKYDHEKTMAMFLECEDWRKNNNIDNMVQTFAYPEGDKVFEYYP